MISSSQAPLLFIIDTQNHVLTHTGTLNGTGALTKSGTGTLHLNGSGNHTGTFALSQGTLTLSSSAGLLTVAGNYIQNPGATLSMTLAPNQSSNLKITGTGTLDGTLVLQVAPGPYISGTRFPLIQANNLTGSFSTVNFSAPYNYILSQNATTLSLTFPENFVTNADGSIDPVIQNIQNSINTAFTTGTTRASVAKTMLAPVTNLFRTTNDPNALLALQTLSHASADQVTSTLTQLSGQQKTVIPAVIDASLGSLHQTLASHLTPDPQVVNTPLSSGGEHPTFVSAKLMELTKATVTDTLQEKERFFLNNSALNRGTQEKGASASSPLNRRARLDDKTTVWLQATGNTYDQQASSSNLGVLSKTAQTILGAEREVYPALRLGGTAALSQNNYKVSGGTNKGKVKSTLAGGYGLYQQPTYYLNGTLIAGHHHIKQSRNIYFPDTHLLAQATHPGYSLSGRLSAGYHYALPQGYIITPSLSGGYSWLSQPKFQEGGAGAFNLKYHRTYGRIVQGIGEITLGKKFNAETMIYYPKLSLGYLYTRRLGRTNRIIASFVGDTANTSFSQTTGSRTLNFVTANAQLFITHETGYTVGMVYGIKIKKHVFAQEGFVRLAFKV